MTGAERPLVVEAEPAFRTAHANPYNARLYTTMAGDGCLVRDLSYLRLATRRIDIVHLHWPELTFLTGRPWRVLARMLLFRAALRVARFRNGTKVVWTVHNVASHERRATPRLARDAPATARTGGRRAALAHRGRPRDRRARRTPSSRTCPSAVTPHGHYRDDYDFAASRDDARAQVGVHPDASLVVSVGMIREYKNIPELVRTVVGSDDPDVVLAVAGKPSSATLAERDPIRGRRRPAGRARSRLPVRRGDGRVAARGRRGRAAVPSDPELRLGRARPVRRPTGRRSRAGRDAGAAGRGRIGLGALLRRATSTTASLQASLRWARRPRAERAPIERLAWDGIAATPSPSTDGCAADRRHRRAEPIHAAASR